MYKKYPKGSYEYANYKKKMDLIYMIILFILPIGLFIIGYISTGSKKNIMSVIAVLGLLPACKMVVTFIMSMRVKQCDETVRNQIDSHIGDLKGFYHMFFTSYDKNFTFVHMVATGNSIIAYSDTDKTVEKDYQAHMKDLIFKEGLNEMTIKVFYDLNKYLNRLDEINNSEADNKQPVNELVGLICNVTL